MNNALKIIRNVTELQDCIVQAHDEIESSKANLSHVDNSVQARENLQDRITMTYDSFRKFMDEAEDLLTELYGKI